MRAAFESITSWITSNFGWWYVFLAFAFVVFCVALGLSKKGDIKLGRPLSVRWGLEPLFGEKRVKGTFGNVIDVIALVGTVFGVSTSLGLGVNQITAGMAHMGWVDESNPWINTS